MNEDRLLERLQEGYRLQLRGQLAEAESIYARVLDADAENPHALNLLGALCINAGRGEQAVALMRRAVAVTPRDPDTQANLGLALKEQGDFEGARAALEESLRIRADDPVTLNNLGNVLLAVRRVPEAVVAYRRALRLRPDYAECLANLAGALSAQRQGSQALEAADRAVRLQPTLAEAHNNRGEALLRLFRYEEAVRSYRQAIALRPDYDAARVNLSAALKETSDHEEARRLLEDVLTREPANFRALTNLGVLLEQLGDPVAAIACLRRAVDAQPAYAMAWYHLARLDAAHLDESVAGRILAMHEDPATPWDDRAPLAFALACIAESRGSVEEHFRWLKSGHEIRQREVRYDPERVAAYHVELQRAFPLPGPGPEPEGAVASGPGVVFVVGMPRSGTSLTEQILASHPEVRGAGELSLIDDAIQEVRRLGGAEFPAGFQRLSAEQRRSLGDKYLQRLQGRTGAARWIVDKTPMNFQYVGFIASILPSARFIHCRRDPMDNCWSIFKLPFEELHSYAHGLDSLGDYYRRYEELMVHWRSWAGPRMLEVQYERLVGDFEPEVRRLVAFLGLDWHEGMRDFHATRRIVKTPSASQVRRPLYGSSVEAWRPYETMLAPLASALGAKR